jgi:hypothetical protein
VAVPLVCRGPSIPPRRVVRRPVLMQALAATFLDAAGVPARDVPSSVTTRSLLAMMRGRRDSSSSGSGSGSGSSSSSYGSLHFPVVRSSLQKSWSLAVTLVKVNRTRVNNQNGAFDLAIAAAAAPDTNDDNSGITYVGCRIDWLGSGDYKSGWHRITFLNMRSNEEIVGSDLSPRLSTMVGELVPERYSETALSQQLEHACKSVAMKSQSPPGPWPGGYQRS